MFSFRDRAAIITNKCPVHLKLHLFLCVGLEAICIPSGIRPREAGSLWVNGTRGKGCILMYTLPVVWDFCPIHKSQFPEVYAVSVVISDRVKFVVLTAMQMSMRKHCLSFQEFIPTLKVFPPQNWFWAWACQLEAARWQSCFSFLNCRSFKLPSVRLICSP